MHYIFTAKHTSTSLLMLNKRLYIISLYFNYTFFLILKINLIFAHEFGTIYGSFGRDWFPFKYACVVYMLLY
jgi:uncharacterized membrane protein